jgi:CRISPR-associated protein Cas2
MQYVVCYDIADDARRSRVSNRLSDFDTRVPESVFLANLEEAHAARLERRLERLVHPDRDRLHILEPCASRGRKKCSGPAKRWCIGSFMLSDLIPMVCGASRCLRQNGYVGATS